MWSYTDLPIIERFNDITDFSRYASIPQDWHVLVADVAGSTKEISGGRYKEVNLIGVSTIAAIVNAVRPEQVPFVFGGDGASFCVPPNALKSARMALSAVAAMAKERFGITLRIGTIPISAIHQAGWQVLVARYRVSPNYVQAMFAGGGLKYAEELVKNPQGAPYIITDQPVGGPDCEGLECRWKEIPSPSDETIAILIQATTGNADRDASIYKEACTVIETVFGGDERHHPVSEQHMRLAFDSRALKGETAIRTYAQSLTNRIRYAFTLRIKVLLGRILIATGGSMAGTNYRKYKREVVANTDRRKFDDTLRLVLACTVAQRLILEQWLADRYHNGELVYGLHVAKSSLMTCLIGNREAGDHLHFVDASGGGYAVAAIALKERMATLRMDDRRRQKIVESGKG